MPINLLNFTPTGMPHNSGANGVSARHRAGGGMATLSVDETPAEPQTAPRAEGTTDVDHRPETTNPAADGAHREHGGKHDPFVSVFKQAAAILHQAVTSAKAASGTADGATATPSSGNSLDPMAALGVLAQFASLMPGLMTQAADPTAGVAGTVAGGAPGAVGQGQDGGLTIDPQLLQALLAQLSGAGQAGVNQSTGAEAADGHAPLIPLGQPLTPEMQAELRQLTQQMHALQQALAAIAAEQAGAASGTKGQAGASAPTPDTELDPAKATPSPTPVPPAVATLVPQVTLPTGDAATGANGQPTASAPVSSAAAQRQAAIDLLLKPLRGELHVEGNGEFAIKGLRTDAAYTLAPSGTDKAADVLQQLVEQGKPVTMELPENGGSLAKTLGITSGADANGLPIPAVLNSDLLDAVPTLTDAAVTAATHAESAEEKQDRVADDTLKADQPRAEEVIASSQHLQPTQSAQDVQGVSEGQRAQQPVMQQVIDKIKELMPGPAQVRMVLNPESLGQLTIRLVSHQGQVSVRVLTENPDVQRMLDGGVGHLKAALAESGVKLDQVQVVTVPPQSEQRSNGQPQHRQSQQQGEQQGQSPREEATAEEMAALERLIALAEAQGS